jgi:hypothetical protein
MSIEGHFRRIDGTRSGVLAYAAANTVDLSPFRTFLSYLEAQAGAGFLSAPVAHFQTDLFLPELTDAAIAAITTATSDAPADTKVLIVPFCGAITRVAANDTAFVLRQPGYEVDIVALWRDPAKKAAAVEWVKSLRNQLQPFADGAYVNQLGETSDELVRMAYGPNYARLVEIKKKYDPGTSCASSRTSSRTRRSRIEKNEGVAA